MDWNDVNYCLAVIREGSVTAAAKKLGVNHTTVSRRITALEKDLEVILFDRSTTGWLLTPVGESIMPNLEQMDEGASAIRRSVHADRKELSGTLRITSMDLCIQHILMPGLKAFTEQYPDINIELMASEQNLDLSVHAADIAFRATNEPPPDVVGKKIADFGYGIYATAEIYKRWQAGDRGVGGISWVMDGNAVPEWMQHSFPGMPVRYRANSLSVTFDLVRQGHGIAMLPYSLGEAEANLVRIPSSYKAEPIGFWLLSHIDLRTTARIRIFRDFMLDYLEPLIPMLEGRSQVEAA